MILMIFQVRTRKTVLVLKLMIDEGCHHLNRFHGYFLFENVYVHLTPDFSSIYLMTILFDFDFFL